jgi:hypothetical protein
MPNQINRLNKEHSKQQHCPTCNRYVKYHPTLSNYVCARCVVLATDKAGQLIAFYHITEAGNGLQGKYIQSGKLYRSLFCFIKGIKSKAEGYEQNIIIKPVTRRNKHSGEKSGPSY